MKHGLGGKVVAKTAYRSLGVHVECRLLHIWETLCNEKIEIVAGRHKCTVEQCLKRGLLRSIMDRLLVAVQELNGKQQLC